MNSDIVKCTLKEIRGKIKETWGEITDNDMARFNGKREDLAGILQKKYGYTKEKAVREVRAFFKKLR